MFAFLLVNKTWRRKSALLLAIIAMLFLMPGTGALHGMANSSPSTPDGLDPTFGTNGVVTTAFTARTDNEAYALALQSDGQLVVAGRGRSPISGSDFAVARLNIDGTLDPSFSDDGKVLTN